MRRGAGDDSAIERKLLLSESELVALERRNPEGLTVAQIVDAFHSRGLKLSEATFRKYVQLGLVPRSRRVGRKGKHQGSMGLYPAAAVRRVNAIKRMMGESYTIEEIQQSFLRFRDDVEVVERGLQEVFDGFDRELRQPQFDASRRKTLSRDVADTRKLAAELVGRIETLERQIVSPLERVAKARAFSSGASGGAGDLL